jgi:hypothetical protein
VTRLQSYAVLAAVVLLLGAGLAAFLPTSRSGDDCGTWVAPVHVEHDVDFLTGFPRTRTPAQGFDRSSLVNELRPSCDDALEIRRIVSLVLLGVAVALPLGLAFGARSRRKRTDS